MATTNYSINPARISNSFGFILNQFPTLWLELKNPQVERIEGNSAQISGITVENWHDDSIGLRFKEVEIMLIEAADGTIDINRISCKQQVENREIEWLGEDSGMGTLRFSSTQFDNTPIARDEAKNLIFLEGIESLLHFANFAHFTLELHLAAVPNLRLSHNWISTSQAKPGLQFGDNFFGVNQFRLNGTVFESANSSTFQSLRLSADILLGNLGAKLVFGINKLPYYQLEIYPKGENLAENFSDILNTFKLSGFQNSAQPLHNEFDFLKAIEIRRILLRLDKADLTSVHKTIINGRINALNNAFDITIVYSNGRFSTEIQLVPSVNSLRFSDVAGAIVGHDMHLPHEPNISAFHLNVGFNPFSYRFFTQLSTHWTIPIGNKSIELQSLLLRTSRAGNDNYSFELGAHVLVAGVDLNLSARKNQNEDGWLFETEIAEETEIHLKDFMIKLLDFCEFTPPDPAYIPDLTVNQIGMTFNTNTHDFSFRSRVNLNSPIGPFKAGFLHVDLSVVKNESGTHDFSMNLNGFIEINQVHVDFIAQNMGQKNWSATVAYNEEHHDGILTLEDICQHFDPHFTIENKELASLALSHFEIDYGHSANGDHKFYADLQLTTQNGTRIEGFFSGEHQNGTWNIAAGIGYDEAIHTSPETKPEILNALPSSLHLDSIWVIVVNTHGAWPRLPEHFPTNLKTEEVTTGIALVAQLDLTQHHAIPGAQVLTEKGHNKLAVLVELTTKKLHIEASLGGEISFPTKKLPATATAEEQRNAQFTIVSPRLIFEVSPTAISLAIEGSFMLHLDGFVQTLTVELALSSSGIYLLADLKFSGMGWAPFGLEDIHITELALELGVEFTPPSALIGFMGEAYFGEVLQTPPPPAKRDKLALVLAFTGPIPNPEYFALAITHLSLSDLIKLFPGTSAHGHSVISDTTFSVDDFELIWCEKPLTLPNGQAAQIGFSCHGLVTIFGWKAYAMLEIHPESGIKGRAILDELIIGPLHLSGKSEGLKLPKGVSNIEVTNLPTATNLPNANTDLETIIKPGGAEIQFNSSSSPYLFATFKLTLLGVEVAHLEAEITDEKVTFDFALNLIVLSIGITCNLTKTANSHSFTMAGHFFLGVDFHIEIDLVFVHIDEHIICGIGADIHLKEENGQFTIGFAGHGNFFGHEVQMNEISFTANIGDLKKLPGELTKFLQTGHGSTFSKQVKDASGYHNQNSSASERQKNAQTLWEMAFDWAKFVHADIAQLQAELEKPAAQIEALIAKIKQDIDKIGGGIENYDTLATADQTPENQTEHLEKLQTIHTTIAVKNADQQRADEIAQMEWEMRWIQDETGFLRGKIETLWKNVESEIKKAEAALIEGQEKYLNGEITPEALQNIEEDRNAIFDAIKANAAKLVADNGKVFPALALEHHLNRVELEMRAQLVRDEILTLAQYHADAIRTGAVREEEETFILNPIPNE